MEALSKLLAGIGGFWQGMNGAQRVAFLSIALMTAGALALLSSFAGRTETATLFSQLEPKDAARISDELATLDVPFELTHADLPSTEPAYGGELELRAPNRHVETARPTQKASGAKRRAEPGSRGRRTWKRYRSCSLASAGSGRG